LRVMEDQTVTNLLLFALIAVVVVVGSIQFGDQQVPCSGQTDIGGRLTTLYGWTTRFNDRYCVVTILGTSGIVNSTWVG